MQSLHIVSLRDQHSIPWANGGGLTRDLLYWPHASDWVLRISVAQIDRAGPFSHLPGFQRWFVVAEGAGVELTWPDGPQLLKIGEAPLCFDGANAPGCRLLEGTTLDLNLMVRQTSGHGQMLPALIGQPCTEAAAWRAVYVHEPVILMVGDDHRHALPAQTLAYCDDAAGAAWTLQRDDAGNPSNAADDPAPPAAWWMSFAAHPVSAKSN